MLNARIKASATVGLPEQASFVGALYTHGKRPSFLTSLTSSAGNPSDARPELRESRIDFPFVMWSLSHMSTYLIYDSPTNREHLSNHQRILYCTPSFLLVSPSERKILFDLLLRCLFLSSHLIACFSGPPLSAGGPTDRRTDRPRWLPPFYPAFLLLLLRPFRTRILLHSPPHAHSVTPRVER